MHSRLSSLLLIGLLVFSLPLLFSQAYSLQGQLLGLNIYLKSTSSDIPGYKSVSNIKPSGSNRFINVTANSTGEILIGQWISQGIIANINLTYNYNFLFSMFAQANYGNASMFSRFYLYREGAESLLFETSQSAMVQDYILFNDTTRTKQNMTGYLWQHKIKYPISIQINDRIIFKLYFQVYVSSANLGFAYDCSNFPSYFNDPTEVRFFTSNTSVYPPYASYRQLNTTNSASSSSAGISSGKKFGIRVYNSTLNETYLTEITSGTPVAQVTWDVDNGEYDATWSCPSVVLNASSRIVVNVYSSKLVPTSWSLIRSFFTEELGASSLDASTWTVHYWLYVSGLSVSFWHGSSTYPSQITNFKWTQAVTKSWHSLAWNFNLTTRQWSGISWIANLSTRQWSGVSWIFDAYTMQWNSIAWILELPTMAWHNSIWALSLVTMGWHNIEWISSLSTLGWHSVYWVFNLGEVSNIPVLFVGLAFFGSLGLAIVGWRMKKRRL